MDKKFQLTPLEWSAIRQRLGDDVIFAGCNGYGWVGLVEDGGNLQALYLVGRSLMDNRLFVTGHWPDGEDSSSIDAACDVLIGVG